jgi:DNA-binding NarL/FixJ family response regulator
MIAQSRDLRRLLKAAVDLAKAPVPDASEIIRIGDTPFRIIAEQHETGGWIVVLMQAREESSIDCNVLKARYRLTERQLQVAQLLAERYSNKEIAQVLDVKVSTAGRHTEHVLKKLGVASRRDVRKKLMDVRSAH